MFSVVNTLTLRISLLHIFYYFCKPSMIFKDVDDDIWENVGM